MGQAPTHERTKKCGEPACRAIVPDQYEFCANHRWHQVVPPPNVASRMPEAMKFFEREAGDGTLKAAAVPTPHGIELSLSIASRIVKGSGKPTFNRLPTLDEVRSAYATFIPDGIQMGIIFPPPEDLRANKNPELRPLIVMQQVADLEPGPQPPPGVDQEEGQGPGIIIP